MPPAYLLVPDRDLSSPHPQQRRRSQDECPHVVRTSVRQRLLWARDLTTGMACLHESLVQTARLAQGELALLHLQVKLER